MYIATKGFTSMIYLNNREKKQRNVKKLCYYDIWRKESKILWYIYFFASCMYVCMLVGMINWIINSKLNMLGSFP